MNPLASSPAHLPRYLGLDVGAETIKLVELVRDGATLRFARRRLAEHHKEPAGVLRQLLAEWDWPTITAACVCGRLSRSLALPRVPVQQAQARAWRHQGDARPVTLVSIGSHGFSVLELRDSGIEVFRENSRCSQGTGNFLRQLVERFSLTVEEASAQAAAADRPATLSGRCPVILKSDMTHLANKGEDRARILAGLFDAVADNVQVLIKPRLSPHRVVLLGGVSLAPRIQRAFGEFAARHEMELLPLPDGDSRFFEALGCALVAAESPVDCHCEPGAAGRARHDTRGAKLPDLGRLFIAVPSAKLEKLPPLAASLDKVRRMPPRALMPVAAGEKRPLIFGFDIGSTGSKAVALDAATNAPVWEGYRPTYGDPVGAAQALLQQFTAGPVAHCPIVAFGATGSGREITGSLLATCYGKDAVFMLNEIAAHAEGALSYDARVDTIFEIGGQDAKYIRLAEGRVVDCAMNEACSAGTGSFIEEQGRKFAGIRDVVQFGQEALAAREGVSLGQHCSVFMAEIIDEAVAAGIEQRAVIAGLYDSIIQNYLNRVKGNRSVGKVIFCQGMPFSSDALAAAVARQTGSEVVIPPNPGTVGALGIARIARRELAPTANAATLDPQRFLGARVEAKDCFICKATTGCGTGNRCRIERLRTLVAAQRGSFTWGGGCALHDKGTRKKKLPDLAPDPFREREELIQRRVAERGAMRGRPRVALSDEFMLKGLFPFFATFLHELGFELTIVRGGDHDTLKRGIQEANVPFCAPMQQFHGLASRMAETGADYLFLPMIRSLPRTDSEPFAVTCPIVQASPDILKWDLPHALRPRVLSPVIDVGPGNLDSLEFLDSCRQLAEKFGMRDWRAAHRRAAEAQTQFERACLALGRRALEFCASHRLTPVVVLGRPYTIYNTVLNSNVPAILREQGAVAIPLDCYPVEAEVPRFRDMFWSHGQRILRAAHQIRRTPGLYSLYCSNYSCGPDSFNLHFYAYIMAGKPFAIIETDGHSGDAGTKTRVEAFLHCVAQDQGAGDTSSAAPAHDFSRVQQQRFPLAELRARGETLLIPSMGPSSAVVAACFRGAGLRVECLPQPDAAALRHGRRHTSGKECLPLCVTLGNLLKRLEPERHTDRRFTYLLTTTHGPCREGAYNLLNQITLERLGWADRVRIWAPPDSGYFDDLPAGLSMLLFTVFMASDLLLGALHDVRPVETRPGAAQEIYTRHYRRLVAQAETAARQLSASRAPAGRVLREFAGGQLFGLRPLLAAAAASFAAVRGARALPTVLVVGEIFVRCEPFSNDFLIGKLERRGLRAKLAPFHEWLDYSDTITRSREEKPGFADRLASFVQQRIQHTMHRTAGRRLDWPEPPPLQDTLTAIEPFLRTELNGEAVLSLGTPLLEWRHGHIDAVVSVGPLECMPNKIAEAQFYHLAEQEGLPSLTLPVNGDPVDDEVLDNFAFLVRDRFRTRQAIRN
jgi:activator of 2-hydroxyglutaryl-CoA dehydratase/predicted nucleotide-binding protein (sugar kinase/HSP70/actin superfamily)